MDTNFNQANNAAQLIQRAGAESLPAAGTKAAMIQATEAQNLGTQFLSSSYKAIANCRTGKTVSVVSMDTRMLNQQENKNPQFDIVNSGLTDQKVIIGSVLGLTGAYAFYGQQVSGVDSANMADQYGTTMRALQGFTALCNYTPVIITTVQMISSDTLQINQPLSYNDVAYDSQVTSIRINTTSTFTRYDTLNTLVKIAGLWAVGPQAYLSINSKAGQSMSLTLTLNSTSSVKSFRLIE